MSRTPDFQEPQPPAPWFSTMRQDQPNTRQEFAGRMDGQMDERNPIQNSPTKRDQLEVVVSIPLLKGCSGSFISLWLNFSSVPALGVLSRGFLPPHQTSAPDASLAHQQEILPLVSMNTTCTPKAHLPQTQRVRAHSKDAQNSATTHTWCIKANIRRGPGLRVIKPEP